MRFEFAGGLSVLNLYQQYIAVIIKGEVNALSLSEKLSNRSYQTCTLRCLSSMRRNVCSWFGSTEVISIKTHLGEHKVP